MPGLHKPSWRLMVSQDLSLVVAPPTGGGGGGQRGRVVPLCSLGFGVFGCSFGGDGGGGCGVDAHEASGWEMPHLEAGAIGDGAPVYKTAKRGDCCHPVDDELDCASTASEVPGAEDGADRDILRSGGEGGASPVPSACQSPWVPPALPAPHRLCSSSPAQCPAAGNACASAALASSTPTADRLPPMGLPPGAVEPRRRSVGDAPCRVSVWAAPGAASQALTAGLAGMPDDGGACSPPTCRRALTESWAAAPHLQRTQGCGAACSSGDLVPSLGAVAALAALATSRTNDCVSRELQAGRVLEVGARLGEFGPPLRSARAGRHGDRSPTNRPMLTAPEIGRIRRACLRFKESVSEASAGEGSNDGWTSEPSFNAAPGGDPEIELNFRLGPDLLQVVWSKVFTDFDAFHVFAGLSEFDLCQRRGVFGSGCRTLATQLLKQCGPGDALWRVLSQSPIGKEDNVLHVTSVDALDDPSARCLWVSVHTPAALTQPAAPGQPDGTPVAAVASEVCGVSVPPPQEGAVRLDCWRVAYIIRPDWTTGVPRARVTVTMTKRPTKAACVFPSRIRREVASLAEGLDIYLRDARAEIAWRVASSPGAKLYARVREHLCSKAPVGGSPCRPLDGLAFGPLSANLPASWADQCEPTCNNSSVCETDGGADWAQSYDLLAAGHYAALHPTPPNG